MKKISFFSLVIFIIIFLTGCTQSTFTTSSAQSTTTTSSTQSTFTTSSKQRTSTTNQDKTTEEDILLLRINDNNEIEWTFDDEMDWGRYLEILENEDYINLEFDLNGGSFNDSTENFIITLEPGESYSLPQPEQTGYSFYGWSHNIDQSGTSSKNIELTAQWEEILYTVNIKTGIDGVGFEPLQLVYGDTIDLSDYEQIENYNFQGWYTSKYYRREFNMDTMPEENITVFGKFESVFNFNNVIHDADFSVLVYKNIYWQPLNSLGEPNSTIDEILAARGNPEELREVIDSLYEVMLYLYLVDYGSEKDNIRIFENNISWEHHEPAELAIITEDGNCASLSNLVNYLLDGDYDEVGFISYSSADGSGHVFNYIFKDGEYYFIDATHYLNDFPIKAIETGNVTDYKNSDFILGNLHKTSDPDSYVQYIQDKFNYPPKIIITYDALNVLPIGIVTLNESIIELAYPNEFESLINFLYDDETDNLFYVFREMPNNYPEIWDPYNVFIENDE